MTRFNRTLIWMAAFLALVAALGSLVGVRLLEIFQANPFFNGVILIVLAAGIVVLAAVAAEQCMGLAQVGGFVEGAVEGCLEPGGLCLAHQRLHGVYGDPVVF